MLSGSFDKTAAVLDARVPDVVGRFNLSADVETLTWNPHSPNLFLVSTEDGRVSCHDALKVGSTVWSFQAHDKATTSISINPKYPSLLLTTSTDKALKFWDISKTPPTYFFSTNIGNEKIFCASFFREEPDLVAIGTIDGLHVFNLKKKYPSVFDRFK